MIMVVRPEARKTNEELNEHMMFAIICLAGSGQQKQQQQFEHCGQLPQLQFPIPGAFVTNAASPASGSNYNGGWNVQKSIMNTSTKAMTNVNRHGE